MLAALKFVKGAVARKDFTPALTHFRIKGQQIVGYNGTLAISTPINVDLDVAPKAAAFVKAIDACNETISLHMATNGKLVVRSGSFKAHVDCIDVESFPDIHPTGRFVDLAKPLLPAFRALEPFLGEDASRPWAHSVCLCGQSAYATNNVVLAEYWLGAELPFKASVSVETVREVLRIGEEPERLQLDANRISFHYPNGRWLSSNLVATEWPASVMALLDKHVGDATVPVPEGFWPALEQLLPFVDEKKGRSVYLLGDRLATSLEPELDGVSVALACPGPLACYNARFLYELRTVAKDIAFASFPAPVAFFGDNVRGIIAGKMLK